MGTDSFVSYTLKPTIIWNSFLVSWISFALFINNYFQKVLSSLPIPEVTLCVWLYLGMYALLTFLRRISVSFAVWSVDSTIKMMFNIKWKVVCFWWRIPDTTSLLSCSGLAEFSSGRSGGASVGWRWQCDVMSVPCLEPHFLFLFFGVTRVRLYCALTQSQKLIPISRSLTVTDGWL